MNLLRVPVSYFSEVNSWLMLAFIEGYRMGIAEYDRRFYLTCWGKMEE